MRSLIVALSLLAVAFGGSMATAQIDATNLKRGQGLYEQHCVRCHGTNGDGLGPEAQYLIVPPASFKSSTIRIKTDRELLMAISQGVLFSPMHAWQDRLSKREMMDIFGYLRMLSPFSPIS